MKIILPHRTLRLLRTTVQAFFVIVFSLATLYCAFYWFNAARFQRAALSTVVPQIWQVRLDIPRLGMALAILEGVGPETLDRAVGHIPGTAWPGQRGNIGLSAHRDTFFRPLRNIRIGDVITLTTTSATYRYSVTSTRIVPPSDVSVLASTGEELLTLVTCHPFYYVGPAPNRFIVRARVQTQTAIGRAPRSEGLGPYRILYSWQTVSRDGSVPPSSSPTVSPS
jgi:LPXTG-site transpeptidase (sortase) family protein